MRAPWEPPCPTDEAKLETSIKKWILDQPDEVKRRLRGEAEAFDVGRLEARTLSMAARVKLVEAAAEKARETAVNWITKRKSDATPLPVNVMAESVEDSHKKTVAALNDVARKLADGEEALLGAAKARLTAAELDLKKKGKDAIEQRHFARKEELRAELSAEAAAKAVEASLTHLESFADVLAQTAVALKPDHADGAEEFSAWAASLRAESARLSAMPPADRTADALELRRQATAMRSRADAFEVAGDPAGAESLRAAAMEAEAAADRLVKDEARTATVASGETPTITLDSFGSDYQKKINDMLSRRELVIEEEDGLRTATFASLVFIPTLNSVQPALIQSFSLRNFLQAFWPNIDPEDIRRTVEDEVLASRPFDLEGAGAADGRYYLARLDRPLRTALAEAVTQERLAEEWFWTRGNVFSLDFGLTGLPIGGSERHKRRVDEDFPQFLLGGSLNFWRLQVSGGAVLFREDGLRNGRSKKDLVAEAYFGISVELWNTALGGKAKTAGEGENKDKAAIQ